jgi:hypothetical protein
MDLLCSRGESFRQRLVQGFVQSFVQSFEQSHVQSHVQACRRAGV